MALIQCPKCGGQISEYAKRCPHCGLDNIKGEADVKPISESTEEEKVISAVNSAETEPTVQNAPMPEADFTPKTSRGWVWIAAVSLVLLLFGGGGFGYWYYQAIYIPEKIDREAPRSYPIVNVQLRSSKMAGGDFNKLVTVPFGGELITYDNDGEWSKVKYIVPGTENEYEGYVASPYLVDKKDFYIINSILADNDVREVIATSKVRKALLDYFKSKEYFGALATDLQSEVGISPGSDNQWQVVFHHGQTKPNEVLFSRMVNANSKFTDMAVLIENIKSHDRKLLYFYFDDDETPHLLFDGEAPKDGYIESVGDAGMCYKVFFTNEEMNYWK